MIERREGVERTGMGIGFLPGGAGGNEHRSDMGSRVRPRVRRVRWAGAGWLGPRGRLGYKAALSLSPSYFF